ncbi:MAG: hypothetical protein WC619_02360 [Patescibacteria group bacterium]
MWTRIFAAALFLFLFSSFAAAQEEAVLQKFIVSALHTGSYKQNEYYYPANNVDVLAGVRTKISLTRNSFVHTRLLYYNPNNTVVHAYLEEKIKWASFNAGFLPRPAKMLNTPDPVSAAAHFLPEAKKVIPGPALGAMAKLSSAKLNSDFFAGVYQAKEDSLEFNLGLVKNFSPASLLHKVIIGGYSGKGVSGAVIGVDIWRLSFMGFSGMDAKSIRTRSVYAETKLRGFNLYADAVHRQDIWETAELGITKELSEKISGVRVNYLCGLGYVCSETRSDLINFYLQVWFDKK